MGVLLLGSNLVRFSDNYNKKLYGIRELVVYFFVSIFFFLVYDVYPMFVCRLFTCDSQAELDEKSVNLGLFFPWGER